MPCALAPSPDVDLAAPSPHRQLRHVRPWGASNLSAIAMPNHTRIFAPLEPAADGYLEALRASQFPAVCDGTTRHLLVEDDLRGQGLGYTREYLVLMLLWAVKERRVMREDALGDRGGVLVDLWRLCVAEESEI